MNSIHYFEILRKFNFKYNFFENMSNPYLSSGVIDLSEESYIEMKEKLLSNPVTHDHHDKMAPPKKKMPYNPVGQVCPSHLANLTHF